MTSANCNDFINQSDPGVLCGWVSAPLDHFASSGARVDLPVLIAFASGQTGHYARRSVLVPGGGGPGAAVGFGWNYSDDEFLAPYQSLLEAGFDVIVTDQRGAGFARPLLSCYESIAVFKKWALGQIDLQKSLKQQLRATTVCKERLDEKLTGIGASAGSLRFFDTLQSAADFNWLLRSLPHKSHTLLATSYATAIAQAMLVLDDSLIDKVVLDSPVPLNFQQPLTVDVLYNAIIKTVNNCQTNKRCNKRYPSIENKLKQLVNQSKKEALKIVIKVWDDDGVQRRKTLIVDHIQLINILFTALYNNDFIAELPKTIDRMYEGTVQALHDYSEDYWYQATDLDYADGLSMSVHCRERIQLERRFISNNPGYWQSIDNESLTLQQQQDELCELWDTGESTHLTGNPRFTTDALILIGSLDPVISQRDFQATTDNFTNASQLKANNTGHAVWYQNECSRKKVAAFLQQPMGSSDTEQTALTCDNKPLRFR